ncbi:hypothetical protein GB937_010089 [Aspergillus fischeri]|nr:hypothetical protein GB937_010089 [Aspergillus fischeri]
MKLPLKGREGSSMPKCQAIPSYSQQRNTILCGSAPICNGGLGFDSKECTYLEEPTCPPGMWFNRKKCVAEKDPVCQPGTVFGKKVKECLTINPPACSPWQVFNGKECALASGDCVNFEYCPSAGIPKCLVGFVFDKHTEMCADGKLRIGLESTHSVAKAVC